TANGSSMGAGLVSGVSFALPGLTTFKQTVAVLPLEFLSSALGQPIAGVIGYDFINQFVLEVDYAKRKINVYAPAALLQKLFSDDFLSVEIKRRRREMFIVTECTSFTVFPNEQNAMHFAHSEGTRESAVYYKHSAATRLFRCAPTSGNPKGTFAAKRTR